MSDEPPSPSPRQQMLDALLEGVADQDREDFGKILDSAIEEFTGPGRLTVVPIIRRLYHAVDWRAEDFYDRVLALVAQHRVVIRMTTLREVKEKAKTGYDLECEFLAAIAEFIAEQLKTKN